MATKSEVINNIRKIFKEYSSDVIFARATELAMRGKYFEAESLLLPYGSIPDNPKSLDLLARISANKGDYNTAKKYWELAIEKEPNNQNFQESLAQLKDLLVKNNSKNIVLSRYFIPAYIIIILLACSLIKIIMEICLLWRP